MLCGRRRQRRRRRSDHSLLLFNSSLFLSNTFGGNHGVHVQESCSCLWDLLRLLSLPPITFSPACQTLQEIDCRCLPGLNSFPCSFASPWNVFLFVLHMYSPPLLQKKSHFFLLQINFHLTCVSILLELTSIKQDRCKAQGFWFFGTLYQVNIIFEVLLKEKTERNI